MNHFDLAVLGGGYSGLQTVLHALRHPGLTRIAWVGESSAFGRGVAYATRDPEHVFNVPLGRMSAFTDDPDHLFRWLEANRAIATKHGLREFTRDTFLPRVIYGRYLSAVLARAGRAPGAAGRLERFLGRAVDVETLPGGAGGRVRLADGREFTARRVIFAPGNFPPPVPPVGAGRPLTAFAGYVDQPWKRALPARLREARAVLILGTSLTALDLVLSLRREGRAEYVHLLSRRGRLPLPDDRREPPYPLFLAPDEPVRSVLTLWRAVRAEVRRAAAQGRDWRALIDSLRPRSAELWRDLDEANQRRFLRHARIFWDIHRHRVAPLGYDGARDLERRGALSRHAGRLHAVRETGGGRLEVRFRPRGRTGFETLTVDAIVNATGPEADYGRNRDPLVANLRARGLLRPDRHRMGVDVDESGALRDASGRPSAFLFTLGSPRRGSLYETIAVAEIRAQAAALFGADGAVPPAATPAKPSESRAPRVRPGAGDRAVHPGAFAAETR